MQIVGIGASAGGIEACRLFFEALPAECGLGFVIVLHMSAGHKSALAEIVDRWTSMTVIEAANGDPVKADHVYVVPAGVVATLNKGCVQLRALAGGVQRVAAPIDEFFDSLATDMGEDAIGIVLSGTGHDGALGLKAIRARGGLTLAQGSDDTAPLYTGMPNSAIATGAVDLIVPVQAMPELILGIKERHQDPAAPAVSDLTADRLRLRICEILRTRIGHDFSNYKSATFARRVQRRMHVLGLTDTNAYVSRLEAEREEAVLLFRDLLIGVTSFFRDAQAFEAVETVVMPQLFDGKTAVDTVRVWVPGCATGEEAYSLAILLREHMDSMQIKPKVQVFATDINDSAIATARAGRYPATLLEGLSPERRDRFFEHQDGSYLVTRELREICTFSVHSLVKDPPFSRMNLVSCRNLLIYMDVELQAAVIPAFHYSLLPGGILLLGSAETTTRHDGLFAPLEKEHRIFKRRDGPSPMLKVPQRPVPGSSAEFGQANPTRQSGSQWSRTLEKANARVLERFAAPFVIVTEDGTLLHYSSHVGSLLQPALGAPSRNLFDMARHDLRHPLRVALRNAAQTDKPVEQAISAANQDAMKTLIVEPLLRNEPDQLYLIVFEKLGGSGKETSAEISAGADAASSDVERELRDLREQLQSLSEEHETALEELRSSNEELHSVNEELQSGNEELETSKEEIQSVNEELHTVNAQLSEKIEELDRNNSDLRNLFESTRVATVFLDKHLVIRAFTPEVVSIFNLIPSDRGRSLTDIVSRLDYDGLRGDFAEVMHSLEPIERRVSRRDGTAHYLLRLLPYRTPENRVDGSLLTLVDVTEIVEAEKHHRLMVDELNHRVKNMLTVVISLAQQTLRRSGTLEEFSRVFLGRVEALTAAYALLSRENWFTVDMGEIIREELKPFRAADNMHLEGPVIHLDPRFALALGMAVHELATNASKYGALSVTEGVVTVTWAVERHRNDKTLVLEWIEREGPEVMRAPTKGFGTTLIQRSIEHELGGKASIDFNAEGVQVSIRVPLRNFTGRSALGSLSQE